MTSRCPPSTVSSPRAHCRVFGAGAPVCLVRAPLLGSLGLYYAALEGLSALLSGGVFTITRIQVAEVFQFAAAVLRTDAEELNRFGALKVGGREGGRARGREGGRAGAWQRAHGPTGAGALMRVGMAWPSNAAQRATNSLSHLHRRRRRRSNCSGATCHSLQRLLARRSQRVRHRSAIGSAIH